MTKEFELDLSKFQQALKKVPEIMYGAAKTGMHDALDDWVVQAKDVAPVDKGILQSGIKSEGVQQEGNELVGEVSSVAIERNKKGDDFNYAYYIHELDAGGKNLRRPGATKKYLDESAKQHRDKWMQWIEDEIEKSLKDAGW